MIKLHGMKNINIAVSGLRNTPTIFSGPIQTRGMTRSNCDRAAQDKAEDYIETAMLKLEVSFPMQCMIYEILISRL
jgi:hypothetical protein